MPVLQHQDLGKGGLNGDSNKEKRFWSFLKFYFHYWWWIRREDRWVRSNLEIGKFATKVVQEKCKKDFLTEIVHLVKGDARLFIYKIQFCWGVRYLWTGLLLRSHIRVVMAHVYMNAVGILGYCMKESEFYQQSNNIDYKLSAESLFFLCWTNSLFLHSPFLMAMPKDILSFCFLYLTKRWQTAYVQGRPNVKAALVQSLQLSLS